MRWLLTLLVLLPSLALAQFPISRGGTVRTGPRILGEPDFHLVTSRMYSLVVAPQTASNIWVFATKDYPSTNQRAVLLQMVRNVVTSTDSEGGSQDLWRLGQVQDINVAYVFFKGSPTLGTTHASGTHAITTQNTSSTLLGPNGNGAKAYWRTQQRGDYVEWENVQGPVISIGTITTTTGAITDVFIDGDLAGTFSNLDAAAPGQVRSYQFETTPGTHTVRVQHNDPTAARNCYVFGVNFFEVGAARAGLSYDQLWYGRNDSTYPAYISSNGAQEYAFRSSASGTWAGNYHGGETATSEPVWKLDGVAAAIVPGAILAANTVTIEQAVAVSWAEPPQQLAISSITTFHDSGLTFSATASSAEPITFTDAYTHMSKTAVTFTEVVHPEYADTNNTSDYRYADGFFNFGPIRETVQREPATGRTVSAWTKITPDPRTALRIVANVPEYRKVYAGLCYSGIANCTVQALEWESTWLFR